MNISRDTSSRRLFNYGFCDVSLVTRRQRNQRAVLMITTTVYYQGPACSPQCHSVNSASRCRKCINSRSFTSTPPCQLVYPFSRLLFHLRCRTESHQAKPAPPPFLILFNLNWYLPGYPVICVQFKDIILLVAMVGSVPN